MSWVEGARFAIGTLSVFPVRVRRVDRDVAGRAMTLAPAVGALLGLTAALPLLLVIFLSPATSAALLGAALSLALLAFLTRALHLDGLADLADALGSAKPAPQALDIMKKSDIGPFGVATLTLNLLIQAAALASLAADGSTPLIAPVALITASVTGRLALTWACRTSVPSARPSGLGAMVAGTVRRSTPYLVTLIILITAVLLALLLPHSTPAPLPANTATTESHGLPIPLALPLSVLAGLTTALLLLRRAISRLGGITGDVLGALVETATTATLITTALLS